MHIRKRPYGAKSPAGITVRRTGFLGMLATLLTLPQKSLAAVVRQGSSQAQPVGRWFVLQSPEFGPLLDLKFSFPDGSYDHNQIRLSQEEPTLLASLQSDVARSSFSIVRPAGEFVFDPSSEITFIPSRSYAEQVRRQGFSDLSARGLLDLALFGVPMSHLATGKTLFGAFSIADAVSWKIFGVSPEYARVVKQYVADANPSTVSRLLLAKIRGTDLERYSKDVGQPLTVDAVLQRKGVERLRP